MFQRKIKNQWNSIGFKAAGVVTFLIYGRGDLRGGCYLLNLYRKEFIALTECINYNAIHMSCAY